MKNRKNVKEYENIHEELCKRMQEASELYVREHYRVPKLDKELLDKLTQTLGEYIKIDDR